MIRLCVGAVLVWAGLNNPDSQAAIGCIIGGCILWAAIGTPDALELIAKAIDWSTDKK